MRELNLLRTALSVGIVIGVYHLAWAGLVAAGWAKPFMDFVLRLHFIELEYQMAAFSPAIAVSLVSLTFSIGAAFGLAFALVWNWLADRKPARLMPSAAAHDGTE